MKKYPMLAGMSRAELLEFARNHGQPAFRGRQLGDWIFNQRVLDPMAMRNLPAAFRTLLSGELLAPAGRVELADAAADGTTKLLIRLHDGETVEMVVIPMGDDRVTFCLSTQVGCPVRCRFCASGAAGLKRNLQCGEIIEELLFGAAVIGRLPDNLVFMGIGEGLLNFDELAAALELISSPDGFGMAQRRITVSTSGIVPGIEKLAALHKEYTLAISLHAVNDAVRAQLIPDGCRYPVAAILQAADAYLAEAGRMVTLEYTLLAGINDQREDALELARLAKAHHAKVNLIPYNATDMGFQRPPPRVIEEFAAIVARSGAHVTVRQERGSEKSAACGQLRRRHQTGE